jgi:DHA1 family bicyclomycin/chloramphenicol resistance-like MFS transporter
MTPTPSLKRAFFTLSGLAMLSPLAFDMLLPAVGDMANSLNTSVGQVMIAWGILSVGSGIGQIIHGPISDRYGRKPVIIFGLLLYILSAGIGPFVSSVEQLFVLRFFQGIAVAATMIIMRAIVRDLFDVKQGAKLFGNLFAVLAVMPIVGPILGGYLTTWFGWQAVFFCMAGVALVVLFIIVFCLDESLQDKDIRAMTPKILVTSFAKILSDQNFITFLMIGMGAYAGLFAVLAGISPVLSIVLKQPADIFGYQFAAIMIGHLIAATLATRIIDQLGIKKMILLGTFVSVLGGGLFLALALAKITTIYSVLIPAAIFLVGFALTTPAMTAGALSNFPHMTGRATSLLGFLQQGTGAIVSISLGMTVTDTQLPMAIAIAAGSLFSFATFITKISDTTLKAD